MTEERLIEWAHSYDGYERLASTPEKLSKLIQPARNSYRARGRVPDWCGVDLLRGWAFLLVKAERHSGGGTLGDEWRDVLAALTAHPSAGPDDRPPSEESQTIPALLPSVFSGSPKMHKDPTFLTEKQARLWEPHVAPINQLVERITLEHGAPVPYVDPDSGGVRARVLVILESPGKGAAVGSGMVSVDNNDETAKNLWHAFAGSGLPRTSGLLWNAVPWYVGDGKKNATPTAEDVEVGQQYLMDLLELTADARVVLAMGKKAQAAVLGAGKAVTEADVVVIDCPHPGPIPAAVGKGESLVKVLEAFQEAKAVACADELEEGLHA